MTIVRAFDNAVPTIRIEPGTVAVLIPAHNEAEQIVSTIRSLLDQSVPPHQIIVICDNCSDRTFELASMFVINGVQVIKTVGNTYKKAGALNEGIRYLLKQERFPQFVITIDADTILEEYFVERSLRIMAANPKLGGLSAVCRGKKNLVSWPSWDTVVVTKSSRHRKPKFGHKAATYVTSCAKSAGSSVLVWLQRAEYERAGATRLRYNVHTLSGAGSLIRAEAIFDVLRDRGELYAERPNNLVEDYEATLEIKRHGWECTNNFHCVAYTDLMLSLPALLAQRRRWVRGSIDELRRRGWKPETRASILALAFGYLGMPLFYWWLWMFVGTLAHHEFHWQTAWILAVVCLYQAWTLRGMSWKSKLIGFVLIPEQLFNFIRHSWLLSSLVTSLRASRQDWE